MEDQNKHIEAAPTPQAPPSEPKPSSGSRWWRWPLWILLTLMALAVALPASLYIPWVQNKVAQYACRKASEATGMDIGLDRILIEWPLDVSVDGLRVVQPTGDTLVAADNLTARLALLPLIDLQVEADSAWLTGARVHFITEDSSLVLHAAGRRLDVGRAQVNLNDNKVDIDNATLTGGNVSLSYFADKVVDTPDDEPSAPWLITARHLALREVNYTMDLLPTIDKLDVKSGDIDVYDGMVDTGRQIVKVGSATADGLSADYRYPTAADAARYAAAHPVPQSEPSADSPWTVTVDSVRISNAAATYALSGHEATDGFDPDHIALTDVAIAVDSITNRGIDTDLTIRHLAATDRSGLRLTDAGGHVAVDSLGVNLDNVSVATLLSDLTVDGRFDYAALDETPTGQLRLDTRGNIALQEITKAAPTLKPLLDGVPQVRPLAVSGNIAGDSRSIKLTNVKADMRNYISATVSGTIVNPLEPDRLGGTIDFDADLANIDFIKPLALSPDLQQQVNLPPMRARGNATLHGTSMSADVDLSLAASGQAVAHASFDSASEGYDIDLAANALPVKALLPTYGIGNVTGTIRASGAGFDFTNPATAVDAHINLESAEVNGITYRNLQFDGRLGAGTFDGRLLSSNDNCDMDVDLDGSIDGDRYIVNATGRVYAVDMQMMGLTKDRCDGKGLVSLRCDMDVARKTGMMDVKLTDVSWRFGNNRFVADSASLAATAGDSAITASFINEDTHIDFDAACGIDTLLTRLTRASDIAMSLIEQRALDIDTLQEALPPFSLRATLGRDGVLQRMAGNYDIDFRDAAFNMRNDTAFFADASIHSMSIGTTTIDTLTLDAGQWRGRYLAFNAHMGNRRGTWDDFAQVDINGGIKGATVDFLVTQRDITGSTGYRVGANATLTESSVVTRLFPSHPIIGYREWTINDDNFFNLDYRTRMIDANVNLRSNASAVKFVTERAPGATTERILVDIDSLLIEEWTRFLPSLPPMSGAVHADADFTFDGTNIEGESGLKVGGLTYDGRKVGDLAMTSTLSVDPSSQSTTINADMSVDGAHVAVLNGTLNDGTTTTPLNLMLSMERFPMRRFSAFIPGKMLMLQGYATGSLTATGTMDAPVFNGSLTGDSAAISLPRYSAKLRLSDQPITIRDNELRFDHYKLYGINDAPVDINGIISARDLDRPTVTLDIVGSDVQLVGGEQRGFSEAFGKLFADASATVRTYGRRLDVRADLAVLPTTNVTYVLQEEVTSLGNDFDEDMVTFVNLNDSTDASTILMTAADKFSVNVLANLAVEQGAKLNAFLSTDGKDRASIIGEGKFKYRMDFAGKSDFTGSYTIESGEVRYTPPVISQKNFTITPGSTLTWTGDILNPTLDIKATNRVKTSVSHDNGNTLATFDVTAILGGSLNNLKLSFDMGADDMGIQNDLQTMSAEQRSQTAINLLLYNTYSGNNAANNINNLTAGSALFSFVNSKINDWAAKVIKGVDLQLGINQYEGQNKSGVQTSYSYRLTKSLFNDRFKIVVGGEYSTDATTSESIANNLLSEVSLEYLLTNSGNMLVRLFRHTDFESVLEGQVSKIGVGFVYKHKLARLDQLFRFKKKRTVTLPADTVPTVQVGSTPSEPPTAPADTVPTDSLSIIRQKDNDLP